MVLFFSMKKCPICEGEFKDTATHCTRCVVELEEMSKEEAFEKGLSSLDDDYSYSQEGQEDEGDDKDEGKEITVSGYRKEEDEFSMSMVKVIVIFLGLAFLMNLIFVMFIR